MSAHRYLPAAQNAALVIPAVLVEHGLQPLINRLILTETELGAAWLFVVMDNAIEEFVDSYAANSLLSDLSRALHGHRVLFSNSYGLRFAVLLSS